MKDRKSLKIPPLPLGNEGLLLFPAPSITDPNGSYTGIPLDGEQPVQDADDL